MTSDRIADSSLQKGALPPGWQSVRLEEVCEFLDSRRVPVNDADRTRRIAGKKHAELYPYYGANGQVGWIDGYLFDEPLILLAEDGGQFGSPDKAIAYSVSGRCWVNNHAHVLRPRALIDFNFCLQALRIRPDVGRLVSGSTRAKLNQETAASIPIPLPPLAEQQRIAGMLTEQMTTVERLRAAAEAQLEAAKALPAACLKEMFEGPEVLVWPQRRLGDLMRLRKEVVHPRERPRGRAVFVGLEHVASGTGARVDSVSIEMAELTGRKPRFYEGDIVYGYLRPYLNKVWVAEFDGLCSVDQYVYAVDPQEAVTSFISAFMRSQVYMARAPVRATPGQLPRIRTEEVASVMINLPPLVEQQRMVGQLEVRMSEAERMTRMTEVQVATMRALPAAMLRRAFSGGL